jgi:hypothetical protein
MNDDFLSGNASHPSVKFADIGDKVLGTVTDIKKLEDRDPTGEVKTWNDGKPKHVWVFTLDTPGGTMSLWARGNMVTAIREAARTANVTQMVDATLAVQFVEYGEAKKGMNAPKIYKAQMKPAPTSKISVDDLI